MSNEGPDTTRVDRQETIQSVELLKGRALSLTSLYLKGLGGSMDEKLPYAPNTWNVNSGTVIFAGADEMMYALPSTERTLQLLQNDPTMQRAEGKGVPALNDPNYWGPEDLRAVNSGFQYWQQLQYEAMPAQQAETIRIQTEQRAALEEDEMRNDALGQTITKGLKEMYPEGDPEHGLEDVLNRIRTEGGQQPQ